MLKRTVKKQLGLISEQLCTCSTLFCILCRYFARLQQETFINFLITTGYTFYGGNVILVLVHFLYWRSFSPWWPLARTYTDVVLLFFSFFSKTSASQQGRARERASIFYFPQPYPLARAVSKSPAVFIFYHVRSTDLRWPLAFLIFSLPLQNFHVVLSTK